MEVSSLFASPLNKLVPVTAFVKNGEVLNNELSLLLVNIK